MSNTPTFPQSSDLNAVPNYINILSNFTNKILCLYNSNLVGAGTLNELKSRQCSFCNIPIAIRPQGVLEFS